MILSYRSSILKTGALWKAATLFLSLGLALTAQTAAQAAPDINYPASTPGSSFTFNGDASLLGDQSLQLTTIYEFGDPNQANYNASVIQKGSFFYNNQVNVSQFTSSFRFRLTPWAGRPEGDPWADGITFTIQNQGPGALGGSGSFLGYAGDGDGIQPSVALKFKTFALGDPNHGGDPSSSTVAMLVNGQDPTGSGMGLTDLLAFGSDFDLGSGATFRADLSYSNSALAVTITNEDTNRSIAFRFSINIPAFVGGNSAYVGFTGGTGLFVSDQRILSWQYTGTGSAGTPVRPTITGITPVSTTVGSPAFQMTIAGSGFLANSVARFDNTVLSNVSVTGTSMVVNVPASLLTAKRNFNLTVSSAGATSNAITFRVVAGAPPQAAPNLQIVGNIRTGTDPFTGNHYVVLLLMNRGTADITGLNFNNVQLYYYGQGYLSPISMILEPGATPPGNLSLTRPGECLQIRWDFPTQLEIGPHIPSGDISVRGISDQGNFNAGSRFVVFP